MSVIQLPVSKQRIPGPYKQGRKCKVPTCRKKLSVYNEKEICNACWIAGLPVEERAAA